MHLTLIYTHVVFISYGFTIYMYIHVHTYVYYRSHVELQTPFLLHILGRAWILIQQVCTYVCTHVNTTSGVNIIIGMCIIMCMYVWMWSSAASETLQNVFLQQYITHTYTHYIRMWLYYYYGVIMCRKPMSNNFTTFSTWSGDPQLQRNPNNFRRDYPNNLGQVIATDHLHVIFCFQTSQYYYWGAHGGAPTLHDNNYL